MPILTLSGFSSIGITPWKAGLNSVTLRLCEVVELCQANVFAWSLLCDRLDHLFSILSSSLVNNPFWKAWNVSNANFIDRRKIPIFIHRSVKVFLVFFFNLTHLIKEQSQTPKTCTVAHIRYYCQTTWFLFQTDDYVKRNLEMNTKQRKHCIFARHLTRKRADKKKTYV